MEEKLETKEYGAKNRTRIPLNIICSSNEQWNAAINGDNHLIMGHPVYTLVDTKKEPIVL